MDLEQRVQLLEQEMEILKNQIQHTLLDIQETVLTQAYPSLRSEASAPAVKPDPIEAPADAPAVVSNGKNPLPPADTTSPNVRRVSLDDIARPTDRQPVPARQNHNQKKQSPAQRLEAWATKRINKVGVEQTRWQIYQYAEQGRLSTKARDYLLNFLDRYGVHIKDEHPTGWPFTTDTPQRSSSNGANGSRRAKPAPRARPSSGTDDSDGESKNVVLRLIAGVYNASTGTKWSKKHG